MIARITFLRTENGGRLQPPLPGYHPAMQIQGVYTSCALFPVDKTIQTFTFNQEYEVVLHLLFPEQYAHSLHPGDTIAFYEGSKKVAQGVLISL